MRNGHIDVNINTTISPAAGLDVSQSTVACRAVASSLEKTNKQLDYPPPHFTRVKLSSILHNTVSAVIAVLYFSRPRPFRLARSVSSRAIFVASGFARCMLSLSTPQLRVLPTLLPQCIRCCFSSEIPFVGKENVNEQREIQVYL